eukprot:scaffold69964_cov68-Phaeocystis_antarctica.AAC.1
MTSAAMHNTRAINLPSNYSRIQIAVAHLLFTDLLFHCSNPKPDPSPALALRVNPGTQALTSNPMTVAPTSSPNPRPSPRPNPSPNPNTSSTPDPTAPTLTLVTTQDLTLAVTLP